MCPGTAIDVVTPGDVATLFYTVETLDGSAATVPRAGPFTAVGQRLDGELGVPTPE